MGEPGKRAVDHQYFVRASPESVFRAISDAKWLTRWLCDEAELVPQTGGAYRLGWKDGPTHEGRLAEFVPGRKVAFEWRWPGVGLEGTTFALSVEPSGEGTIVSVSHTGFPKDERWTDLYGGAEWGWTYFALNLKSVLESGHDLRAKQDG